MRHGTQEQKKRFLPAILSAEISFCSALSEADAGSDLAALTTSAERRADEYVVHGTKLWCSVARTADYCWTAVRTSREGSKHNGITTLIIDMHSDRLTVKPIRGLTDEDAFCEVLFDGVQVPVANRVGKENGGWGILAEHLDFERAGIERLTQGDLLFRRTMEVVKAANPGHTTSAFVDRLRRLAIEFEVGRLLCYRVAALLDQGQVPSSEASQAKVFGTEWAQRVARAALHCLDLYGHDNATRVRLFKDYLYASSLTVAGGTTEIQKNITALRGLELPRA